MRSLHTCIIISAFQWILSASAADFESYDDCILSSMKGVTSDVAAREIARACSRQFPKKLPSNNARLEQELKENVLNNVAGGNGFIQNKSGPGNAIFSTTINNRTTDWTLSQITVAIVPKGDGPGDTFMKIREYNVVVSIPPLTLKPISVVIEPIGSVEFSWYVKAARGRLGNGGIPTLRSNP